MLKMRKRENKEKRKKREEKKRARGRSGMLQGEECGTKCSRRGSEV
jgi:hypothetical protein